MGRNSEVGNDQDNTDSCDLGKSVCWTKLEDNKSGLVAYGL